MDMTNNGKIIYLNEVYDEKILLNNKCIFLHSVKG